MRKEDLVPEVKEVLVKEGDTWQLGRHLLYCCDSIQLQVVPNEKKVSVIFTDPPWAINTDSDRSFHPQRLLDSYDNAKAYLWGAQNYAHQIENFRDGSWFVWDKGIGQRENFEICWSNSNHRDLILTIPWQNPDENAITDNGRLLTHPTQKPVQLAEFFLGQGNEVVLDPFVGSGSTLIACEKLGHICIAMEIDPYFCQMTLNRFKHFTGVEPVKLK